MEYSKYKDLPPLITITCAQNILKGLGLKWSETILQPSPHLYSTRLEIEKLEWGTNGKGTTEDFSRASAYGEMMERLQNLHLPDLLIDMVDEATIKYGGFTYFPDESSVSLKTILEKHIDLKEDMRKSYEESDNILPSDQDLYEIWTQWNDNNESFKSIPFYSIRKKEVVQLPFEIVRRLCRSNGMASGNSFDEALCQALSEVIERYALEMIFTKQLTPPEIPKAFIKERSPELYNTIIELEKKGPFKLLVFDGSLGHKLPVVCIVFIDYLRQKYRIKFGCHPLFCIALERCLTELAQGCDFSEDSNEKFLTSWDLSNLQKWDTLKNWSTMFRSNYGSIPLSIFYSVPSWKFVQWKQIADYDNNKGSKLLMQLCLGISTDVYIRDNNFLGFPSVRVYVPGISTVYKFNPLGNKNFLPKSLLMKLQSFPSVAKYLSKEDKMHIYDIFKKDYHSIYAENLGVSVPILLGAINAELGHLDAAIRYLNTEIQPSLFIKAVVKELEMRKININEEDRDNMLTIFFGAKYKTYVALNWRDNNIVNGLFDPFRLKRGNAELDNCFKKTNDGVSKLFRSLKKRMEENIVSQDHIGSIIFGN